MPRDVVRVDPVPLHQLPPDAAEEDRLAVGMDRQVQVRLGGGRRPPRVDDDDRRMIGLRCTRSQRSGCALTEVRVDEDDRVRQLEVAVAERKGVEAERLLAGGGRPRRGGGGTQPATKSASRCGQAPRKAVSSSEREPRARTAIASGPCAS